MMLGLVSLQQIVLHNNHSAKLNLSFCPKLKVGSCSYFGVNLHEVNQSNPLILKNSISFSWFHLIELPIYLRKEYLETKNFLKGNKTLRRI